MSRYVRYFLLSVFLFTANYSLKGEFRTFSNTSGQQMEAELLEASDDKRTIYLKLKNGREIEAFISAFSPEDQKYIRDWAKARELERTLLREDARLELSVKMNRKSRKNQYNSFASVDDKTQSFFPELVIENEEVKSFKDVTVRLVIIAEDKRDESIRLVVSASTLQTNLVDRGKTVLEGDSFRLRLYEYDSSYSSYEYKYGYEYEGFVIVLKNAKGEITHTRASKSKYLANMRAIMNCKAGDIYDENFYQKLDARPNSYFVR